MRMRVNTELEDTMGSYAEAARPSATKEQVPLEISRDLSHEW